MRAHQQQRELRRGSGESVWGVQAGARKALQNRMQGPREAQAAAHWGPVTVTPFSPRRDSLVAIVPVGAAVSVCPLHPLYGPVPFQRDPTVFH